MAQVGSKSTCVAAGYVPQVTHSSGHLRGKKLRYQSEVSGSDGRRRLLAFSMSIWNAPQKLDEFGQPKEK